MSSALAAEYRTYYSGETGRVGHEMILDLTNFKHDYGIDCGDIAHRLMDYGFHAPTLSFPVHETLMVEPTESEPKAEMDRFMEALVHIKRECEAAAGQEVQRRAQRPHTAVEIAGEWSHPYARREAAFPLGWIAEAKFWPYVSKKSTTATATATSSAAARSNPHGGIEQYVPTVPYHRPARRNRGRTARRAVLEELPPAISHLDRRNVRPDVPSLSSRWSRNPIICTIFCRACREKRVPRTATPAQTTSILYLIL